MALNQTRDHVELTPTSVRIAGLEIPIKTIVSYLEKIPSGRRELALVHAIDVGVTEILARRTRFHSGDAAPERRTVDLPLQPTASQFPFRQPEAADHPLEKPAGTQSCDEFLIRLDESIETTSAEPPRSAK